MDMQEYMIVINITKDKNCQFLLTRDEKSRLCNVLNVKSAVYPSIRRSYRSPVPSPLLFADCRHHCK